MALIASSSSPSLLQPLHVDIKFSSHTRCGGSRKHWCYTAPLTQPFTDTGEHTDWRTGKEGQWYLKEQRNKVIKVIVTKQKKSQSTRSPAANKNICKLLQTVISADCKRIIAPLLRWHSVPRRAPETLYKISSLWTGHQLISQLKWGMRWWPRSFNRRRNICQLARKHI